MTSSYSRKRFALYSLVTFAFAVGVFGFISACTDKSASAKPNLVHKDAPRPGIVAKIGGVEITEEELIGEDKLSFFDLKKREYDLRMQRLKDLMVEKLIGAEAKKAGMETQKYIEEKILKGKLKVADKEYNDFLKEKRIPESQINAQLKERIMNFLQDGKKEEIVDGYVSKLTKSDPVEVYFSKPKLSMEIAIDGSPVWGKKDAKVTVVEFSDFQCPFCARGASTVDELKKKYGGKIKIAFKHFPLPMHREARPASEASMCINDQDGDKFWKFHDAMFKNQSALDTASLEKYAKEVGADLDKFKKCMDSKKYADLVQKDLDYGEKIGVRSTPTFFINGQLVTGAVPLEQFSEIIDDELATN